MALQKNHKTLKAIDYIGTFFGQLKKPRRPLHV